MREACVAIGRCDDSADTGGTLKGLALPGVVGRQREPTRGVDRQRLPIEPGIVGGGPAIEHLLGAGVDRRPARFYGQVSNAEVSVTVSAAWSRAFSYSITVSVSVSVTRSVNSTVVVAAKNTQ